MIKRIIILLLTAGFVIVFVTLFLGRFDKYAVALSNVIEPTHTENLVEFECPERCIILGPKRNDKGIELKHTEYQFSIINTKLNGISTVSIVVNQGDIVVIAVIEQDQPIYYLFSPGLNLSHQFSPNTIPLVIDTTELEGDYVIMLQDSLDPKVVTTNFQAAVLRVE